MTSTNIIPKPINFPKIFVISFFFRDEYGVLHTHQIFIFHSSPSGLGWFPFLAIMIRTAMNMGASISLWCRTLWVPAQMEMLDHMVVLLLIF